MNIIITYMMGGKLHTHLIYSDELIWYLNNTTVYKTQSL